MSRESIEKYSIRYAVLKIIARLWHSKIFYRKIIVIGKENINPDDYLIIAPNHQNALMDALAVLFTMKGQPVFLARADIFRKKFIASLLYFLKILPVYRIRDGFSTLKDNEQIFEKTIDVLKHKNGLVILPEGSHEGVRRLRQLKKGICRIAFQAAEAFDYNIKLKIIPVGIEFSHYYRIRQVLTVVYGKPIDVSEYYNSYRNNPTKAINDLRERLSSEMKKIMVHIEPAEDYEAIDELRNIINGKYHDSIKKPKLFRDRELIERLNILRNTSPELYRKICNLSLEIKKLTKKLNIDYRLLERKNLTLSALITGIMALLLSFPLFLYGVIFNFIFYIIPDIVRKKFKDKQFYSSVIYTLSLFLAMLFLPVYLILLLIFVSPWWLAVASFVTIPLAGIFAWNYRIFFHRMISRWKINHYIRQKNSDFIRLREYFNELFSLYNSL